MLIFKRQKHHMRQLSDKSIMCQISTMDQKISTLQNSAPIRSLMSGSTNLVKIINIVIIMLMILSSQMIHTITQMNMSIGTTMVINTWLNPMNTDQGITMQQEACIITLKIMILIMDMAIHHVIIIHSIIMNSLMSININTRLIT